MVELDSCIIDRDEAGNAYVDLSNPKYVNFCRRWVKGFVDKEVAAGRWSDVRKTWAEAELVERITLTGKIKRFAASLISRGISNRRVEKAVFDERWRSCHGIANGVSVAEPCPSRDFSTKGEYHFCNDCGCGERERARISEKGSTKDCPVASGIYLKLMYPTLECPRKRAGFSNHSGVNISPGHRQNQ